MYIYENPEREKGKKGETIIPNLGESVSEDLGQTGTPFLGDGVFRDMCWGSDWADLDGRKLLESFQVILMQIEPFMLVCNI